ncbi:class I SAM-dependent methyltransferase [Geopsychrobacter electrodiphilus]|uniref:class I SAM-dependent methyltransferase n=1 Tax=Geopsychrobacter electrodiphilus TaxID=225196 RepID=UPI000372FC48|nr:class I SAM-dependent methyltransferase [Geopsychrobacter electrodiphilus]
MVSSSASGCGSVEAHYAHQGLETALLSALSKAGLDLNQLTAKDLAPIDEFHIGGRRATLEFARQLDLSAGLAVLDIGSGLGGASRCLATEFGCRVTGIDLSAEYCRVANMLATRLGLDSRVSYQQGNALSLPFADNSFDLLWTQHTSMNIADKARLFAEMWRVLKPGGRLAIYDVLAGAGGPVLFPVPWARDPSISHLISAQQLREQLECLGFEILSWQDSTEKGRVWFRRMGDKIKQQSMPGLGIHLLLGNDFRLMAQNQVRNLEEDRIALIEASVQRPV